MCAPHSDDHLFSMITVSTWYTTLNNLSGKLPLITCLKSASNLPLPPLPRFYRTPKIFWNYFLCIRDRSIRYGYSVAPSITWDTRLVARAPPSIDAFLLSLVPTSICWACSFATDMGYCEYSCVLPLLTYRLIIFRYSGKLHGIAQVSSPPWPLQRLSTSSRPVQ